MTNFNEDEFNELSNRMKIIADADQGQYHNSYSLKRYLKAFKTADEAFKAILKTNKWKIEYGVAELTPEMPLIASNREAKKAIVLKHRDLAGRPVIYIPAKNHNVNNRNIDELTKFIVFCLEEACNKCFEEVVDNLCIVFDLQEFGLSCMDYQMIKNLIWLLSRHYPERLGVCLVLNAPTLFSGCWTVIKAWLDENTSSKVFFVNSETELCSFLIPDILPNDV
ncbi:PREDICTED: CRAL-TRIO domain-containing protein C3H8.02 [Nicrophorus vespilloides]|uniref:CRAL-TRIO domain-containing protein C3H8.02 n=1 Tax=Nicrophorus vespilloides TaxID=110193 RepID=A0ABM1NKA6_NICVS|nr:PREDICTED: CRAL-TRIO domain-containing protein C3H8.02 [Nicrophorus vespilloides]XP_017787257.1 PREDICTED: CRAL-TRIO domain-containing protein C3H8.02 [Nicrophorus vespilloides]